MGGIRVGFETESGRVCFRTWLPPG